MPNEPRKKIKTEVMRVGVPMRVQTLRDLLDTLADADQISTDTIVRYYNGQLIFETPVPTLDV